MWRSLKHFLTLWDGIWSVPLSLLAFLAFGIVGEKLFGAGFGAMSPEFFHAQLYAVLVIVFLNVAAWLGLFFNFRTVFHYYLTGSKTDFKSLKPWQKISLLVFLYCLFFFSGLAVILSLV